MITQQELKELLHYCPKTGVFTWLVSRGGKAKKCSTAGSRESSGYIQICIKRKAYMAHRLAWLYEYGRFPLEFIDHKNGERTDNRIANLREVNKGENQRNQKRYSTNKSGVTGVSWHSQHEKWYTTARKDKKTHFLGLYDNIFDAAAAAISARNRLGFHENHGRR